MSKHIVKAENEIEAVLLKIRFLEKETNSHHDMSEDD